MSIVQCCCVKQTTHEGSTALEQVTNGLTKIVPNFTSRFDRFDTTELKAIIQDYIQL